MLQQTALLLSMKVEHFSWPEMQGFYFFLVHSLTVESLLAWGTACEASNMLEAIRWVVLQSRQ